MIGFANNVAHQGKSRPETLECNIPVQRRSETYADLFPSTSAVRIKGYLQTESYLQVSYPGYAIATNTFSQLRQRSWEGCCRSERINL